MARVQIATGKILVDALNADRRQSLTGQFDLTIVELINRLNAVEAILCTLPSYSWSLHFSPTADAYHDSAKKFSRT